MTKLAFILAAGQGTRMYPLTQTTPKPLIKLNEKPLIKYTLDLLKTHGFTKIGVNIYSHADKLERYLRNKGVDIVKEKSLSGTAGGILAISKKIKPDSPFLVIASDMLVNFDLTKIYKFHQKHQGIATLCCYFRPKSKLNSKKSGQILFDRKSKKIKQLIEKSEDVKSQWINSGVYVFNPEVVNIIKSYRRKVIDIPNDLISYFLENNHNIFAYPINRKKFYQLGIDTPDRIAVAEADIKSGNFVPTIP